MRLAPSLDAVDPFDLDELGLRAAIRTGVSDTTKATLEAALNEHLTDEGMLREGELVTDWLLLAASIPAERTVDEDAIYTVVTAEHMMTHHALGLAAWYLHDRYDSDRRD